MSTRTQTFDWRALGEDDGGLPVHIAFPVDEHGNGPTDDDEADHWRCWCDDERCPLTLALLLAHESGRRRAAS